MKAEEMCRRLGWTLETVDSTASTNADLVVRSESGLVLVAHEQTAGRGRLDRTWVSLPGDGLTFSVRLDVPATVTQWGWIPLLAGLATADAIRGAGGAGVGVKWPNDVVAGGKLAGILSQRSGDAVVVGIGINLRFGGERPDSQAVSVAEVGGDPDGDALLAAVLEGLHRWWQRFIEAGGDARRCGLAQAYEAACVSIGVEVQVAAPDRTFSGLARGIDTEGRLVVEEGSRSVAVAAGDVTLRA